jgi:5-methyltetrahydropteroyltriglutamate--homocysteine methyltransferase
MSPRSKPPFRADHVGSLLRPQAVLEARRKLESKEISAGELRHIEDDAIRYMVKRQEEVGLQSVTDGELRRGTWHMDFLCRIGGVIAAGTQVRPFRNESGEVKNEIVVPKVVERLHLDETIFGEDFSFLKATARAIPKLTIPSPSMLHGLGSTLENGEVYRDPEQLFRDLTNVYVEEIRRLAQLGCTYLQIDDTMFATLGDPNYRDKIRATAGGSEQRHLTYIKLINAALANRPATMTVCVHTCRGNHRSAWVASGGYDLVAEAVFNELQVNGLFLEYDDERSGTFEPLRFVPKGRIVVLGFVTTKKGQLENKDDLKRRIDAAAKYAQRHPRARHSRRSTCRRNGLSWRVWGSRQSIYLARSASARRPATVMRTRITSIARPAITRSACAFASPSLISSPIISVEKPCASTIASVVPSGDAASSASARRRSELRLNADCGGTRLIRLRDTM